MTEKGRWAPPAIRRGIVYLLIALMAEAVGLTYVFAESFLGSPDVMFLSFIFLPSVILFLTFHYLARWEASVRKIHPIIYFFGLTAGFLWAGAVTLVLKWIIGVNGPTTSGYWGLFWLLLPLTMFAGWLAVALADRAERKP